MEINKHICFDAKDDLKLLEYLRENNIRFEIGDIVSCLDIYESSPHWEFVSTYVNKKGLLCVSNMLFTKQELEDAEWLIMRSQWRNGYPQPEKDFNYEMVSYTREEYCDECGSGLRQIDSFRIKKEPKWGKRHFMMLNWIEDELFVNESAKSVLQRENISGVFFKAVKNKKGDMQYSGVYQMVIPYRLKTGCIETKSGLHEVLVCPKCGVKKYHPNGKGKLAFWKEVFEDVPDVVKTEEVFGWGHSASHEIIVRQSVYQTILKNQLDSGLMFEPVDLECGEKC